jgi:hypothetical protein
MTLVYRSTVGRRLTVSEGDGNISDLSASIGVFGTIPLAISVGGTGQSTAALAFGALKQDATSAATGVVELATQAEMDAGTAGKVPTTDLNKITLGTPIATTSGTAHDFTVPSGTRRVTLMGDGVSLSGTDNILVQIGPAAGPETSGYVSISGTSGGDGTSTAGFIVVAGVASSIVNFSMDLHLLDGSTNRWAARHNGQRIGASANIYGHGNKAIAGELSVVRVTRTGTDTFDTGLVNIQAER